MEKTIDILELILNLENKIKSGELRSGIGRNTKKI